MGRPGLRAGLLPTSMLSSPTTAILCWSEIQRQLTGKVARGLIEQTAPVFRFAIASLSRTHQRKVKKSPRASTQQVVARGRDRPVNDRASANERRLRVADTRFQGPIDGLEGSRQTSVPSAVCDRRH